MPFAAIVNIQLVMVTSLRISMSMIKKMFELQRLGVVKVQDDNLICDPSYSVIDYMQMSLLLT